MNFGRFCESGFWMAKVAMNRMSEGNTFYGRKLHITSYVDQRQGSRHKFLADDENAFLIDDYNQFIA